MYEKVKRFYDLGIYKEKHVEQFYIKGYLTQEEYEKIIGGDSV